MADSDTSGLSLEALGPLYRLDELEGWQLLVQHFEITEGFSFVVVLAPDDWGVALVRERLGQVLSDPDAVRRVRFDPEAPYFQLAQTLLDLEPMAKNARALWIASDPADQDSVDCRDEAWRKALARLNRYRNTIQARFDCTLVLAGPVRLQAILRESAPDLWSIRSGVFRIEPPGANRAVLECLPSDERGLLDRSSLSAPGDPAITLGEAEKLRSRPGRELLRAELVQRAGRQFINRLQWPDAVHCFQEAYQLQEEHSADPAARISTAGDLVVLFHELAKYDRALYYARRALETAELHLGEANPATAAALNNLARLLQDTNRLAEAEPLMRRALALDQRAYDAEHPTVAIRLNNLAQLLQATNRMAEAEPLMRRALAVDEQAYGAEHPTVAIRLNNLAQLLQATNRLAEAEPLMRRALAIDEQAYGNEHPNVAVRLNNLAQLLQATNRMAEAEPLMRRALAIDEQVYSADHPRVAVDLNNLAQLLQATNRLAEAEPLMHRALAIDEQSYGADHPTVAIRLNNLAEFLRTTNRLAEAEPPMRRALAIDEQTYGVEHPNVGIRLNNLAQLLQSTNRLAEAESLMRRAVALFEKSFGESHPSVATALNNLASLLQATNRLAEAEPLMRRHVKILRRFGQMTGHAHPNWQGGLANYSRLLKAMGLTDDEIAKRMAEFVE